MGLLSRVATAVSFLLQMLGILILGLIFIIAPGVAMSLGVGIFRFKTALAG
ncbi:MAG: hypothetical protein ACM3PE_03035 [Deltaproteobacteria bacterium]